MHNCHSCKFVNLDTAQCRKNPPVAHVVGFDGERNQPLVVSVFPSVRPMEDGCGEHTVNLVMAH